MSQLPQRQIGAPIRGHQQHPVLKRELPGSAMAWRVGAFVARLSQQLAEDARAQPGERGYPDGSGAVITPTTAQDHPTSRSLTGQPSGDSQKLDCLLPRIFRRGWWSPSHKASRWSLPCGVHTLTSVRDAKSLARSTV